MPPLELALVLIAIERVLRHPFFIPQNWYSATRHSRMLRPRLDMVLRKASKISLVATSSVRK